jgi:hypothetical protein|nr:MAG TPA: hypothetical protein [Caudoviricetes sp.]
MSTGIEVKNYKLKALPLKPIPNAILYIKGDTDINVTAYITDVNGVPYPLKDNEGLINPGVQSVFNIDGSISVIGSDNVKISIQSGILSVINSAIQPEDLPSTKSEYNTTLIDGEFLFVGDVVNYTDEQAQDAVGSIFIDTSTIGINYNDSLPEISVAVKPNSITSGELSDTINITEFVNNAGFETTTQLDTRDINNRNRVNHTGVQAISTITNLQTSLDLKENKSEKNVANGYAPLDSNSKIPLANINDSLLGNVKWYGLYNGTIISSSPVTSLNGQSLPIPSPLNIGWYFIANTSFTYDFKNYETGDWIISNGIILDKVDNTDAVSSVFGRTGNITAQNADYTTALIPDTLNKRYVTDANLTTIGNQSGINTGDETTATIQSKRPIKTINTISLEGSGNATVSTDNIPNNSSVSGSTTTNALNSLNTLKSDDSNVIHKTLNETKTGTLSLITPNIAAGTSGLNGLTPIIVTGGKGGDNTNTSGTVIAGNAANIFLQAGLGGSSTSSGTAIGGKGGDFKIMGGDGGFALGTGTLIPGNGGVATVQAGSSYGGQPGFADVKAGNNNTVGGLGGNVFLTAGWGNNNALSNPLYDGTIFLGVSGSNTVRGNTVIGNTIDDRINRLQVTGSGVFTGTVIVSPAILDSQAVNLGQLNSILDENRNQGVQTLTLDGLSSIYNIPHGLGATPVFAFAGRGNSLNFDVFNTTWDATNIIITYQNPPLAGSLDINWIALK